MAIIKCTARQFVQVYYPDAYCKKGNHDPLDIFYVRLGKGRTLNSVYVGGATAATAWRNAERKLRGA